MRPATDPPAVDVAQFGAVDAPVVFRSVFASSARRIVPLADGAMVLIVEGSGGAPRAINVKANTPEDLQVVCVVSSDCAFKAYK